MKELDEVQQALDNVALALPDGFVWPVKLRREYEKACRNIVKLSKQLSGEPK